MLNFILLFISYLFLSSLFINGWRSISSGEWTTTPDNKKKWKGNIFSGWERFLSQGTTTRVPYAEKQWEKKWFKLKKYFKDEEVLALRGNGVEIKPLADKRLFNLYAFAAELGINIMVQDVTPEIGTPAIKNMYVMAYEDVKTNKLPDWVTKPLGLCVTCMSSVYGFIMFMLFNLLAPHFNNVYVQQYLDMGLGLKVLLLVVFCITLSYTNEFLYNKKK